MSTSEFLKASDVFLGLTDEQVGRIASLAKEESFATGCLLYREGEPSTNLYVVRQGKIFLEMKSDLGPARPPMQVTVDVVTRREAFGWSAFVQPNLHTLTALVAEPTQLIVIPGGRLKALMDEDCSIGYGVMQGLARLLASRLNHTRVLLIGERALAQLTTSTEYA